MDVAQSDGHEIVVAGHISPLAVMQVTVDGRTAAIGPSGDTFTARIPARSGVVEVVAIGITGETAHATLEIDPAPALALGESMRVVSHAAESTMHVASVKLEIEGGRGGKTFQDMVLDDLENEILVGGKRFRLYRAPQGLVYLRTTPTGQRTFLREIDEQEMVLVPGGVGRRGMGDSPPYGPVHLVRHLPFLIDRMEVNGAMYSAFLEHMARTNDGSLCHPDDPGREFRPEGWTTADCPAALRAMPVTGITWYAAYAYARWVGGHLPSEAQWEYAAAGATGRTYPWGEEMDDTRCSRNSIGPVPTDSNLLGEGPFSLLHMCGNVREWCDDRFDPRWYERCSRTNPRGPSQNTHRVVRGGSFATGEDALRLQHRQHLKPATRLNDVGFRVAMYWTLR